MKERTNMSAKTAKKESKASHTRNTNEGNTFEALLNPNKLLEQRSGYTLQKKTGEYLLNGQSTGIFSLHKGYLSKMMEHHFGIDMKNIMGKNRQPDFGLLNINTLQIYIGETKNQKVGGSADEKVHAMEKLADKYRELAYELSIRGYPVNMSFSLILRKCFFLEHKDFQYVYKDWSEYGDIQVFFMNPDTSTESLNHWVSQAIRVYDVTDEIKKARMAKWQEWKAILMAKKQCTQYGN